MFPTEGGRRLSFRRFPLTIRKNFLYFQPTARPLCGAPKKEKEKNTSFFLKKKSDLCVGGRLLLLKNKTNFLWGGGVLFFKKKNTPRGGVWVIPPPHPTEREVSPPPQEFFPLKTAFFGKHSCLRGSFFLSGGGAKISGTPPKGVFPPAEFKHPPFFEGGPPPKKKKTPLGPVSPQKNTLKYSGPQFLNLFPPPGGFLEGPWKGPFLVPIFLPFSSKGGFFSGKIRESLGPPVSRGFPLGAPWGPHWLPRLSALGGSFYPQYLRFWPKG